MNDLSVCAPEKTPEKATEKSSVQNKEYFFHSNHDEGVSTAEIILQADGFLGQTWRYLKKVPGNKYTSFYYRCTHCRACPQVKVNTCCFTGRSNIFVELGDHQHLEEDPNNARDFGIRKEVKMMIDEYERLGVKVDLMRSSLIGKTLHIPTPQQMHNYLHYSRKKDHGELGTKICLSDIINMYNNHKDIPSDEDKMFVVDQYTNPDDKSFRIFFSTIRLLKLALLVGFFWLLY